MQDELNNVLEFLDKIIEHPNMKIIIAIVLWLLQLLFGPVFRPAYGTVIILFIADFITGYSYAWMNPNIIPESRRMLRGLIKLLIYFSLLFVAYQASTIPLGILIQTTIEAMIVLTETKSVLENIKNICNLKKIDITFLNTLLSIVQGRIEKIGKEQ